jgi:ABC-type molybdate transport system substrate-binding protein
MPGEVVVEKSSSALLVPDVVTGHVDAAIAYHCDTLASQDSIDVVRIESTLNEAIQPISIARNGDHKALTRRLYNRVTSSPEAFTAAGFEFLLDLPSTTPLPPEPEDAARVD